jgi:F420-non-reducing hydrogenase large subunit
MSLKKAAEGLIKKGVEVTDGILNMIEMAFRSYDPCFSCATHRLPGQMPMILEIREADGSLLQRVVRD